MDTKNYVLGKGKLYFAQWASATDETTSGMRYLGNTTEFNLTVASETLDHYDSDEGVNTKDSSVQTQLNRTGTITTDNMSDENLAMFLLGDVGSVSQAATPVTGEYLNGGIALNGEYYYQVGESASNPSGVRGIGSVTVTVDPDGSPSTAVLDTDYTIDTDLGLVYVIAGGALDGAVGSIDYTPTANSRSQVVTNSNAVYGTLKFVSTNPQGKLKDVYIPSCQLTANGDLGLKGTDWQSMGFNLSVNQKTGYAAIYVDGRPV